MLKHLFYLSFFGLLAIGCAPPQPELSEGADSTSSASNTETKRLLL